MLRLFYPSQREKNVFAIDYKRLHELGFRGIIFDIDNTLVHHGDDSTPEVDELFRTIHGLGLKTVLLTNNDDERVQRFIRNIDTMYICDAGKPKPAGYKKAVGLMGLRREQVVFVGDQVFTDILGANLSGMASILVDFIRLDSETYFGKRRDVEAFIMRFYTRSKNCNKLYKR